MYRRLTPRTWKQRTPTWIQATSCIDRTEQSSRQLKHSNGVQRGISHRVSSILYKMVGAYAYTSQFQKLRLVYLTKMIVLSLVTVCSPPIHEMTQFNKYHSCPGLDINDDLCHTILRGQSVLRSSICMFLLPPAVCKQLFLTFLQPSLSIGYVVAQILVFPIGRAWEKLPRWSVPLGVFSFDINPGKFTIKEHAFIVIVGQILYHWQKQNSPNQI